MHAVSKYKNIWNFIFNCTPIKIAADLIFVHTTVVTLLRNFSNDFYDIKISVSTRWDCSKYSKNLLIKFFECISVGKVYAVF